MSTPDTTRSISPRTGGIAAAALRIARKRAELLGRMRSALESDNLAAVVEIARQLCGVSASQKARIQ